MVIVSKYEAEDLDMWTEQRDGSIRLEKGTKVYHGSHEKIKSFLSYGIPESTCFFLDNRCMKEFVYEITTGKNRTVSCYGSEEVRFDIREEDRIVELNSGEIVGVEDV